MKEKVRRFLRENKDAVIQMGIMLSSFLISSHVNAATGQLNSQLPWNHAVSSLKTELTGPIPTIGAVIACAGVGTCIR